MAIILITGSSTGIGYAIAETLARTGNTVYATMRNPSRSPELQQMAVNEGLPITVLPMDVLDDESVELAVNTVLSKEKQIDVLVNNAGISALGAVEELPMDLFQSDMNTNYFGTVRCTKAVLKSMREKRSGTIINISTVAAEVFSNFHSTYSASKAAIEAFSESLAQEMIPFNVKVVLIQPAFLVTPIFGKANELPANTQYPNIKRYLALFAAALEGQESASKAGEVVDDVIAGRKTQFRVPVGLYAEGLVQFRKSMSDEDWINSVLVSDEEWMSGMEQMGLQVRKYMQAESMPDISMQYA